VTPRIDVAWLPAELGGAARSDATAVVIDVIRATTSIATALAAGASRIEVAESVEEARAKAEDGVLLCGERGGLAPPGFDLGNSPGSFTAERVGGRPLVFTTTNGTRAMRAAVDLTGGRVRLACFRNLAAAVRTVAADLEGGASDAIIVCAAGGGRVSMDDAWCAGHVVEGIAAAAGDVRLTDGAKLALELARRLGSPTVETLAETAAGRAVLRVGLEEDLSLCVRLDDLDVVPIWRGRAFVKGGEEGS
jgi:2-phosphosulfolactate phosphatase